jgi:hypothetical protein
LIERHAEASRPEAHAHGAADLADLERWQAEGRARRAGVANYSLQGRTISKTSRIAQHDLVFTTYPLLWRDIGTLRAHPATGTC